MGDFEDILGEGFALVRDEANCFTITHLGVTKKPVGNPIAESHEQKKAGYWLAFKTVCELLRVDFVELKLVDRSIVTITAPDGQTCTAKVIGIEGGKSDGDPCVRITLERAALAKQG